MDGHVKMPTIAEIREGWYIAIDGTECASCLLQMVVLLRQLAGRASVRLEVLAAGAAGSIGHGGD